MIVKKIETRFVRVDFYNVDVIYFSKITFTTCAGYMKMNPEEWDIKLGKLIVLPFESK